MRARLVVTMVAVPVVVGGLIVAGLGLRPDDEPAVSAPVPVVETTTTTTTAVTTTTPTVEPPPPESPPPPGADVPLGPAVSGATGGRPSSPPTTAYNAVAQPNAIKHPGDPGYGERGQVTQGGGPAGITFPDPAGKVPIPNSSIIFATAPTSTVPVVIRPWVPPTTTTTVP